MSTATEEKSLNIILKPFAGNTSMSDSAAVSGMAAVIAVLVLFLVLAVIVIVALFVQLQKNKHTYTK